MQIRIDDKTHSATARLFVTLPDGRLVKARWGSVSGRTCPAGSYLFARDIRAGMYPSAVAVPIHCRVIYFDDLEYSWRPFKGGAAQGALLTCGYEKRVYLVLYPASDNTYLPRNIPASLP